jgi:hypothetical protein
LIRALANIRASVQDKPCDLQEQRIMAQIVLHPQLMSNTNAPRLVVHPVNRQHIFLRCKVLNPERVDLYVLLSNLTGSGELEKCRQTLCSVGNSSNIPSGILLDVKHSYVLSTLFRLCLKT